VAVEYGRRGARVNAEFSSEILHIDGGQSPDTENPYHPPFPRSQLAAARPLEPGVAVVGTVTLRRFRS
jgi:hypothetical protein